jgi:hypothetical protein
MASSIEALREAGDHTEGLRPYEKLAEACAAFNTEEALYFTTEVANMALTGRSTLVIQESLVPLAKGLEGLENPRKALQVVEQLLDVAQQVVDAGFDNWTAAMLTAPILASRSVLHGRIGSGRDARVSIDQSFQIMEDLLAKDRPSNRESFVSMGLVKCCGSWPAIGDAALVARTLERVHQMADRLHGREGTSLPNLERYRLYRAIAEAYWRIDQKLRAEPLVEELFVLAAGQVAENVLFGELFSSLCGPFLLSREVDLNSILRGVRGYHLEGLAKDVCSYQEGSSAQAVFRVYSSFLRASAHSELTSCAAVILTLSELIVPYRPQSEIEIITDLVIDKVGMSNPEQAKQQYVAQ